MWVNIASTNGHATAMKIRDRLGKLMTPTQIAEAQRLAREWVESQQEVIMKFLLIIILTMSSMGNDPKTIELRIPQENKEECLKTAKTFDFKLPFPGIVLSMKSRCEPKKGNDEPRVTQIMS